MVREALIAARLGSSAMHDPTEGGVRAGIHEVAFASRVRLDVDRDRIPVREETAALCRHFGIDPLGLIGPRALLVTVPAARVARLRLAWARQGVEGHLIGSVRIGHGVRATHRGRRVAFPWRARDEIITALERDAARSSRGRARVASARLTSGRAAAMGRLPA